MNIVLYNTLITKKLYTDSLVAIVKNVVIATQAALLFGGHQKVPEDTLK